MKRMNLTIVGAAVIFLTCGTLIFTPACMADDSLEKQFRELPMEARRLTGPLFWLHGDESKERLEMYLEKIAESGNGCFTAESRPHKDWLGEGWYRDLDICLQAAKKHNMKMWIFDERWWPSQKVGGKVPFHHGSKRLMGEGVDVEGPNTYTAEGHSGERYIATLAGKLDAKGKIEGDSLIDLKDSIKDGKLSWKTPAGKWKVMKFTYKRVSGLLDGASRDSVDWFIQTVYQPHYDRFKDDFGKTIVGYFYDEPETHGDWGTELNATLEEWKVDWKKAYVAYRFGLAGEESNAAKYQYMDALAETWGRTIYGGMTKWCHDHNVVSIGHFLEHGGRYISTRDCAGDMMRLQKYSDMGGIDLVCKQMYPGQRPYHIYQTPKLASSITHVYNKVDDITMCETFGAYKQDITYPHMKWLTDQMQVRGVNFMIPHAFNPRAPKDNDCPPYFYNGGFEPRYPLYRVYADYTSRLSLLLTGGRHICPIALLFSGMPRAMRTASVTPEHMTTAIQDALYDCDWLPFEAFESDASLEGGNIVLHKEKYQVLIVPPVGIIPYATLEKAKDFFEDGGIVIGYSFLPKQSATIGKTSSDIATLRKAIWGDKPRPGTAACKKSQKGGKSYFINEKPSVAQLSQVLAKDAGIPPVLEVLEGDTGNWLHVLHREKDGRDVFLVCNQNHEGSARKFKLRAIAKGTPEIWDAMRNEINSIPHKRNGNAVDFDISLEPSESVLVVFQSEKRRLPARIETGAKPLQEIAIAREPNQAEPEPQPARTITRSPVKADIFNGTCDIPSSVDLKKARIFIELGELTPEAAANITVNGKYSGGFIGKPFRLDVTKHLKAGANTIRIEPFAPKSAKLAIYK